METQLIENECAEQTAPEQRTRETADTKKCPFCAEWIQSEAIKCRHCGEFFDGSRQAGLKHRPRKWYYATGTIVITLLCLGPIALPLVWTNRRYKPLTRVIITVMVLAVTVLCIYLAAQTYQRLINKLDALGM